MSPLPESGPRRTVESLTVELLTVYEELSLLYSLGATLGRLTDEEQIGATALRQVVDILSADCGWVALWQEGKLQVPRGCRIGIAAGAVECLHRVVIAQGQRHILLHAAEEECAVSFPDAPARLLACPLPTGATVQGHLCLGRRKEGRIFTTADQKLLAGVAAFTGVALENARLQRSNLERLRLENELELARDIQRALLPSDFYCAGFLEAAGESLPCYEIGGDYFDLFPVSDQRCLFAVADVSGKGPAAALSAAMVQGIVHAVSRHSTDPPELMQALNDCIRRRGRTGNFVTAFLGALDREGRLDYSNGGHNPPLWIRSSGQVIELPEGGPMLGVFEHAYSMATVQLAPGDLVLLYTDGVTDSENPASRTFGARRLLRWAAGQAGRSPEEVKQDLLATVKAFCRDRRQPDDLTFLVIRYRGISGLVE